MLSPFNDVRVQHLDAPTLLPTLRFLAFLFHDWPTLNATAHVVPPLGGKSMA